MPLNVLEIKKSLQLSKFEMFFVISLVICFQTTLPILGEINYFIRYFICFFWVIGGIFYCTKKRLKLNFDKIYPFLLLCLPGFFIVIYTLFLLLTNVMNIAYVGRSISCFVAFFSPYLILAVGYLLFRNHIFKISIISIILSFILIFITNTIYYGLFDSISQWLQSMFFNNSTAHNHFEVHDLTFASCELLVFIIFFQVRLKKKIILLFINFIIFISGFKRIAFLALCLMVLFIILNHLIFKNVSTKIKKNYIIIVVISFILLMYGYIYLIDSGMLVKICELLNINTMDRIHFYTWLSDYFTFSPTYIGSGFGAASKLMNLYNPWGIYFGTSSIHSDVLRLYYELGFIGFLLLLFIYFYIIPHKIYKQTNFNMMYIYICIQILLFIFHLTDNTYTYFTTQYVYGFIVISLLMPNLQKIWRVKKDG